MKFLRKTITLAEHLEEVAKTRGQEREIGDNFSAYVSKLIEEDGGRMISVEFEEGQEALLRWVAKQSGLSAEEVVRRAVIMLNAEVQKRGGKCGWIIDELAPAFELEPMPVPKNLVRYTDPAIPAPRAAEISPTTKRKRPPVKKNSRGENKRPTAEKILAMKAKLKAAAEGSPHEGKTRS